MTDKVTMRWREDDPQDMVVLRSRAERVIEWWNSGQPRKELEDQFGYVFSTIKNGKLIDSDTEYKARSLVRRVVKIGDGVFEGIPMLFFKFDHQTGGCSGPILERIDSVRIVKNELVFYGDGKHFSYRIQEDEGLPIQFPTCVLNKGQITLEVWV
ncbi:MAG: hypothetical protein IJT54_05110 [Candidatus Methanomethylophilaceae archaeon]|nr:hypothetical protein [Candidatus Methanomethylophilaceae archaeon]